jgi:hypothetical protein
MTVINANKVGTARPTRILRAIDQNNNRLLDALLNGGNYDLNKKGFIGRLDLDQDVVDLREVRPLAFAIEQQKPNAVNKLLNHGAEVKREDIAQAVQQQSDAIVDTLMLKDTRGKSVSDIRTAATRSHQDALDPKALSAFTDLDVII